MSKLNNALKKAAPGIIELVVNGLRHYRDNKGLMDIDPDEAVPHWSLEEDAARLEHDPLIAIAKQLEDASDLDLGYSTVETVGDVQGSIDDQLSHVGHDSPAADRHTEEKVYGAEAKSYAGQSDIDYCIECAVKHGQTAQVLMREAVQRAEVSGPEAPGVKEKVRGVTAELTGVEHDTDTVGDPSVMALNTMARGVRKFIYTSGAEIGRASKEDLNEAKTLIGKLVEAAYMAREAVDCPTCSLHPV